MTEEKKLTEAAKSELIIKLDDALTAEFPTLVGDDLKKVRDELFAKTNYCASQKVMISDQIKEINVITDKIIKYRNIIRRAQENTNDLYYSIQAVGSIFNELHDKLAELSKNSDTLQAGDLLKILNDYDKFSVDETVFEAVPEVSIDLGYEGI